MHFLDISLIIDLTASPHPSSTFTNTHSIITNKLVITKSKYTAYIVHTSKPSYLEPQTYAQASKYQVWVDFMAEEYASLLKNDT